MAYYSVEPGKNHVLNLIMGAKHGLDFRTNRAEELGKTLDVLKTVTFAECYLILKNSEVLFL